MSFKFRQGQTDFKEKVADNETNKQTNETEKQRNKQTNRNKNFKSALKVIRIFETDQLFCKNELYSIFLKKLSQEVFLNH